jgi:hypothetical protein
MSNQKVRHFSAAVGAVALALGIGQVISGAGVQAGHGTDWTWPTPTKTWTIPTPTKTWTWPTKSSSAPTANQGPIG